MHVKSGDTVIVISGTDQGRKGKVQKAFPETNRVIVEGVKMVKRHQKPRGEGMPGGIVDKEAAISASKVMIVCPKCHKPTRVGHKFTEGDGKLSRRKVRICKKCGASLGN
ncbi:MAG: 50S ribosomal protein L24 [Clostridiales bacterium]|nr:50S ribosomal protein L24 [Clostridiales bacterium]